MVVPPQHRSQSHRPRAVRRATGLFASLVLSTLPRPTSPFTSASAVFSCAIVRFTQAPAMRWMTSLSAGDAAIARSLRAIGSATRAVDAVAPVCGCRDRFVDPRCAAVV